MDGRVGRGVVTQNAVVRNLVEGDSRSQILTLVTLLSLLGFTALNTVDC
jgi:hypothetical protein